MHRIRTQLAHVAAGWLVLHLSLLGAVPTSLCAMTAGTSLAAECTCTHGDGQLCPMHHTRTKSSGALNTTPCSCRDTADPLALLTASLVGPAAVMPSALSASIPIDSGTKLRADSPYPPDFLFVPDSPPPRA